MVTCLRTRCFIVYKAFAYTVSFGLHFDSYEMGQVSVINDQSRAWILVLLLVCYADLFWYSKLITLFYSMNQFKLQHQLSKRFCAFYWTEENCNGWASNPQWDKKSNKSNLPQTEDNRKVVTDTLGKPVALPTISFIMVGGQLASLHAYLRKQKQGRVDPLHAIWYPRKKH